MENRLQTKIISWLKSQGAYVVKMPAVPGVPVGCPDILFLFEGAWGVIEVKASARAKFQPLQRETLLRLKKWCPFVYVCHPDNWPAVKEELTRQFF